MWCRCSCPKLRNVLVAVLICAALMSSACFGQQTYVTRFDAFAGYSYFDSPKVDLKEHGVHLQAAVRPSTWYSLGFDYTNVSGDLMLTPGLLVTSVQESLRLQLGRLAAAGQLPPGYALAVVTGSRTQTFAAGPQVAFRRWVPVTPFIRPSIGLIREVATPKPADPIAKAIVAQLAPEGKKIDWTPFYGVGGGVDLNFTRHLALRVQADFVWDHLFPDILREGRKTVRFSIGPAFNFGKNIMK